MDKFSDSAVLNGFSVCMYNSVIDYCEVLCLGLYLQCLSDLQA